MCYIMRAYLSNGCEWLWRKLACRRTLMYPKAFADFPTRHQSNSQRSELHEKSVPYNDDRPSGCSHATARCNLPGADPPAICRTDGEDLWSRFVGADRRHPLYLEHRL